LTLENWSKKAVMKYHEHHTGSYAGDVLAHEVIRLSKKYVRGRILDVGSGSGTLINLLPNGIGIDLAPKHSKSIKADATKLPFKDGSFNTVFCTEVLEHLCDNDLDKTLDEIRRVLSKGGYLIITVPYKEDLELNTVICPKCGTKFHRFGHMQVFDEKRILSILKRKRLEVVKINILPLSFMARHTFLKCLRVLFEKLGFLHSKNIFVIVRKP